MKKFFSILLFIVLAVLLYGCGKGSEDDVGSTLTEIADTTVVAENREEKTTIVDMTASAVVTTTVYESKVHSEPITEKSDEVTKKPVLAELETSEAVTYFSGNVNNRYIQEVVKKYGVEATSLVALIRTKAKNPGATVLEFSGEQDSDGNLIMTEDKLVAVYEVSDTDGSVKKATGKMTGNDGYNYVTSLAVFKLTKEYIIPNLEKVKNERPYTEDK